MPDSLKRAAENSALTLLARVLTVVWPLVGSLLIYLSSQWLDQRFAEIRVISVEAKATAQQAAEKATTDAAKIAVIEATVAASDKTLDQVSVTTAGTNLQVAAIRATLDEIIREQGHHL